MLIKCCDFRQFVEVLDQEIAVNQFNHRLALQLVQCSADVDWRDSQRFCNVMITQGYLQLPITHDARYFGPRVNLGEEMGDPLVSIALAEADNSVFQQRFLCRYDPGDAVGQFRVTGEQRVKIAPLKYTEFRLCERRYGVVDFPHHGELQANYIAGHREIQNLAR